MAVIEDWRMKATPEQMSLKEAEQLYESAAESYLKALQIYAEVKARDSMRTQSQDSNLRLARRGWAESILRVFEERAGTFVRSLY